MKKVWAWWYRLQSQHLGSTGRIIRSSGIFPTNWELGYSLSNMRHCLTKQQKSYSQWAIS